MAKLPWGFTNESWVATTPDGGRDVVTRMASPAAAAFVVRTGPEIARRVAAVGLAVPAPIPERSDPSNGIVVSRWLDGTPAMSRLDGAGGAAVVGEALGDAWRRLAAVDIAGLPLDRTWTRPAELATAAEGWLTSLEPTLGVSMTATFARLIGTVAVVPAAPRPSFVHGDLVPANMLLHEDGNVLLDLEAARIGDSRLDAAWFRWIVAYHHPELAAAAWSTFAAAAQLAHDDPSAQLLRAYPVLRILEILAGTAPSAAARDRWIAQLASALSNPGPP